MKFKKRALLVSSLIFISCLLQIFYFINAMGLNDEVDPFFGNNEAKENFRAFEANP